MANGNFANGLLGWDYANATYTFAEKGMAWLAWGPVLRVPVTFSQTLAVQGGTSYRLSYLLKGGGGIPNNWRAEVAGHVMEQYTDMAPVMDWRPRSFGFRVPEGVQSVPLIFQFRQVRSQFGLAGSHLALQ